MLNGQVNVNIIGEMGLQIGTASGILADEAGSRMGKWYNLTPLIQDEKWG